MLLEKLSNLHLYCLVGLVEYCWGYMPPLWKFLPLKLQILAALVKFVPRYQKIAEFTDISTNAARETEQLAFTLRYLVGLTEHCQQYMPHCGNVSFST